MSVYKKTKQRTFSRFRWLWEKAIFPSFTNLLDRIACPPYDFGRRAALRLPTGKASSQNDIVFLWTLIIPILFIACTSGEKAEIGKPDASHIHSILDTWHKAAADADFEAYFSHFESDSSIFMGTDATERWTVAEFKPWSKPYFDRGKAWSFEATERYVYFSDEGTTAWFDEVLETPNLGPSRGTGVLAKTANGWKITHYNLTIPIPNEIVGSVVEQIDSVLRR